MIFSVPALLALVGVAGLALFPDATALSGAQMGPDRATLWFLVVCAAIACYYKPLFARLVASRDASTWALLVASFVLFHLADRGPHTELSDAVKAKYIFAPETISYATYLVVICGLLSLFASGSRFIKRGGAEKSVLVALALVVLFGFGMFSFLSGYFPMGAGKTLDPYPMATLLVQSVAYGALAICCRAATEDKVTRALVLRALPVALLVVVARHQLAPIPTPKDDE